VLGPNLCPKLQERVVGPQRCPANIVLDLQARFSALPILGKAFTEPANASFQSFGHFGLAQIRHVFPTMMWSRMVRHVASNAIMGRLWLTFIKQKLGSAAIDLRGRAGPTACNHWDRDHRNTRVSP
jgi:hypothetical protein